MNDLINRQAAIQLAIDLDYESRGFLKESKCREIENRYNMIPSAQQPEIIRCKDCKYFDGVMERCDGGEHPTTPDAFCSYAVRIDG